jgi:type II secretory pathway pseudopilin PulG
MIVTRPKLPQRAQGGFTLVELLLTVGIIMLLAGAVVFNFGSLDRSARLDESATLVESLFRYARAQASSRGREVVVVFGDAAPPASETSTPPVSPRPETPTSTSPDNKASSSAATSSAPAPIPAGVQVLWEPDPVGAPGKFELLPGAFSLTEQLNELIRVREVRPPGQDAQTAATAETKSSEGTPHDTGMAGSSPVATRPVKFFPDGSSDSVEVVLGTLDEQDVRRLLVSLSGTTGTLHHRFFSTGPDGEPAAPAAPGVEGSPGTQP